MKKIISKLLLLFFMFALMPLSVSANFKDVDTSYKYYEAIQYLYEKGIVEGYSDNTFRPDTLVNRVEALKIILLGAKLDVSDTRDNAGFPDVDPEAWYAKYVVKAKAIGIVKGNGDGTFAPNRTINFAEALKIVLNTSKLPVGFQVKENPYPDIPQDAWYARFFLYAKDHELLNIAEGSNVSPAKEMTRGDIADLMYRVALHMENKEGEVEYASYYSDYFQGKNTASGEPFDQNKYTAAHRSFPFGTRVKVTNTTNDKSVIVTINDRGPHNPDRVIDLSKRSFEAIAPLSRGIVPVVLEELRGDSDDSQQDFCDITQERSTISQTAFEKLTLNDAIPTLYAKNEIFLIAGTLEEENDYVTVFLTSESGEKFVYHEEVEGRSFSVPVHFGEKGMYQIGIIPGKEGVSKVYAIEVVSHCLYQELSDSVTVAPKDLELNIIDNDTILSWDSSDQLTLVSIFQGSNKVDFIVNNGQNTLTIPYHLFQHFSSGEAIIQIASAKASSNFSVDQSTQWVFGDTQKISIVPHISGRMDEDHITPVSLSNSYEEGGRIRLELKSNVSLRDEAYHVKPDGHTEVVPLNLQVNGGDVSAILDFIPDDDGTHILSFYNEGGEAMLIHPVYVKNTYPFIPDLIDLRFDLPSLPDTFEIEPLRQELIKLVNDDRMNHGATDVEMDTVLNELAQDRAKDMVENGYFSHINLEEKSVNDLRIEYGIKTFLAENITIDADMRSCEYSLMLSGSHRQNIIDPQWTRVGFGIQPYDNHSYLVVQLFSNDPIDAENMPHYRGIVLDMVNSKRIEAGSKELVPQTDLQAIAQEWSERMARDSFTAAVDADGNSINDLIISAGVESDVLSLFIGVTSLSDAESLIDENQEFHEETWKYIGIGIAQGTFGDIKITLLYGK